MNLLAWLELIAKLAPALSIGIQTVLHFTGADKHKTVAGEIAQHVKAAGELAESVQQLLNGIQKPNPRAPVAETPGGGA